MMTRIRLLVLMMILSPPVLSGRGPAVVQGSGADPSKQPAARVTLPQSVGPAGGTAAVAVQFVEAEGRETGRLDLTIRFPSNQLAFKTVEVGGLGTAIGARATARFRQTGSETVLEVTIATTDAAGAMSPLPSGPIAQLLFTVSKDLKPETVIPVKLEASASGISATAAPVKISAGGGEVIVSNPSVISCFFYMH